MRRTSWTEPPPGRPPLRSRTKRGVIECPLPPYARVAVLYLLLVTGHTLSFAVGQGGGYLAVLCSLPLGPLLGCLLLVFGRGVSLVRGRLLRLMSTFLVGFLLFFVYLVGYIVIFSLAVSLPLEWCFRVVSGSAALGRGYVLYSVNFVIVLALASWLRWLVGAVREHRLGTAAGKKKTASEMT